MGELLKMTKKINISVPFTDSQLSCDCIEEFFNEGNFDIEIFLSQMYNEGYNMGVFE